MILSSFNRFACCLSVARVTLIDNFFATSTSFIHHKSIRSAMASSLISQQHNLIIKSPEDKREYRGLLLKNGMKVLLISDPTTDKSSAAMDVNIGSLLDPIELPGLAHFCEHMLFLGTKKYPEENEYNKYLNEHGGSSNAFTSGEHTNFYFDVDPTHFTGALDRFAQFFTEPLFTPSAVEREVNAVNSENDKNLQNDSWRIHQLEKSTSKPGHDFTKFGTGNKDTLLVLPRQQNKDPRDELLKFHDKYYSANLMALAVLGKESLDDLTELVLELFANVENKNVPVPEWNEHPYGPDQLKLMFKVVPIKDIRSLAVLWPIPDLHPFYKTNPGHYIGHLIGHEGTGSLLSELKNRGWVNELVGGQHAGANGFMFFGVNVDLTEEGIEHVNDIVTLIFQYINLLRQEGPKEWIFRECQDLSTMSFRFKDKERPSSYTCLCASNLHDYPIDEVLSAGYINEKYDPELIQSVVDKLVPEYTRLMVAGKKFNGETELKEQWYGTEYSITKLSEETIQSWSSCGLHENLSLPEKNEFIPSNFDLLARDEEPSEVPVVLRDTRMTRLWYCQDNKFLLPKACVSVQFVSPYAYMDPLSANLTYIFSSLLRDALTEYTYAAHLAGLGYDIHSSMYGLMLTVKGYNDKQHVILQKLMDKITSFDIDSKRFDILLEKYIRGLKNFRAEQPHQHAIYYTNILSSEQLWTKDELLEATEETTLEKLRAFLPRLFSQMFVEMFVYGNVNKSRAVELADTVESILVGRMNTRPLLPSQKRRFREVQLPDGSCFVYQRYNEVHKSSSLEVYYQCSVEETRSNMLLELFCQVIGEPCFDILRTQEQLVESLCLGATMQLGHYQLFMCSSPSYGGSRAKCDHHTVLAADTPDLKKSWVNPSTKQVLELSSSEGSKGYIVFSGVRRSNGVQGLRIIVQSDKTPEHVDTRIELFLEKMKTMIEEMSDEAFDKQIGALAVKRLEKPKKMSVQNAKFWSEITNQLYNFNRDEIEVNYLKTLTKGELLKFYQELIAQDSPHRRKLSVHIISTASPPPPAENATDSALDQVESTEQVDGNTSIRKLQQATPILDVTSFKRDLGLFPLPKPFINVGRDSEAASASAMSKL